MSASADQVPGDQVNLNRLRSFANVTASTWLAGYRPENILDMRNLNGWSPDTTRDETPKITVTLVQPLHGGDEPFATVQLNFGHGQTLVAAQFEVLALTGVDDGSDLPPEVIAALMTDAVSRSPAQTNRLQQYYIDHAEETATLRRHLANAEERLATLTKSYPTMVMDKAPEPRETFILHRGDYMQPGDKVKPGIPSALPPLPEGARRIG